MDNKEVKKKGKTKKISRHHQEVKTQEDQVEMVNYTLDGHSQPPDGRLLRRGS